MIQQNKLYFTKHTTEKQNNNIDFIPEIDAVFESNIIINSNKIYPILSVPMYFFIDNSDKKAHFLYHETSKLDWIKYKLNNENKINELTCGTFSETGNQKIELQNFQEEMNWNLIKQEFEDGENIKLFAIDMPEFSLLNFEKELSKTKFTFQPWVNEIEDYEKRLQNLYSYKNSSDWWNYVAEPYLYNQKNIPKHSFTLGYLPFWRQNWGRYPGDIFIGQTHDLGFDFMHYYLFYDTKTEVFTQINQS